jgi:hypothetical protein
LLKLLPKANTTNILCTDVRVRGSEEKREGGEEGEEELERTSEGVSVGGAGEGQ